MVEEVDAEIGRVLDALEETGEADNTVIIFNSDHGEGAAHHQTVLKNFAYDEASRVPFIISFPEELRQGIIDEEHLVSGLDVVPTLCDFAGADPPKNARGLSVRQIAGGVKADWREFLITEMNRDVGRMIRTRDYKLVAFRNDPDLQFFHMKNDPGETTNLAKNPAYSDQIETHIHLLEEWESRLNYAPNSNGLFTVSRNK
jgi:arylsulfatase A-like enzyme